MADFPPALNNSGVYHVPSMSAASAEKVSSLLQQNHNCFHVFWNFNGYHNHQVHYLLTAYALGADPGQLQCAFDGNRTYQRQRLPIDETVVRKLSKERHFKSMMGNDSYFNDYTVFFQRLIEQEGWRSVVQKYIFSRNEIAEELLVGLFAGMQTIWRWSRPRTDGKHRGYTSTHPFWIRYRV